MGASKMWKAIFNIIEIQNDHYVSWVYRITSVALRRLRHICCIVLEVRPAKEKIDYLIQIAPTLFFCVALTSTSVYSTINFNLQIGLLNSSKLVLVLIAASSLLTGALVRRKIQKGETFSPTRRKTIVSKALIVVLFLFFLILVFSTDFSIYLDSQPDRRRTYFAFLTWAITFIIMLFIRTKDRKFVNRVLTGLVLLLLLYLSSFLVLWASHPYHQNALNLSIVFNPIVQNLFGRGIHVDLRSQYGMYPEFITPIMELVGIKSLNGADIILFTSVFFSLAFFCSYLSIYIFLCRALSNMKIAAVSVVALTYLHLFALTLWPHELYLQYYPIRTLFPMISLPLLYFVLKDVHSTRRVVLTFFVITLGVFWNLDVGLPTLIAFIFVWILTIVDSHGSETHKEIDLRRKAIFTLRSKNFWIPGIVIVGTVIWFLSFLRLRRDAWINLDTFFLSQKLFLGGNALPADGLWRALFFCSLISFTYWFALRGVLGLTAYLGVYLNVLNLGLLTYFVNNTHPSTLANSWWALAVLAALHLDMLLKNPNKKLSVKTRVPDARVKSPESTFSGYLRVAVILSLSVLLSFFAAAGIINLKNSQILKDQVSFRDQFIEKASDRALYAYPKVVGENFEIDPAFVEYVSLNEAADLSISPHWEVKRKIVSTLSKENGFPREILILSNWDYLLYAEAKRAGGSSSPNFYHTFTNREWEELFEKIESREGAGLIILDNQFGLFQGELKAHPPGQISKIFDLLKLHFELREDVFVGWTWYLDSWQRNSLQIWERRV